MKLDYYLDKCANRHKISSNDTNSPQIQPTTRTHQSDSAQSRNHHFSELLHEIVTVQVPQPMIMTIHTHPARNQYFLKLLLEFTITLTLFFPSAVVRLQGRHSGPAAWSGGGQFDRYWRWTTSDFATDRPGAAIPNESLREKTRKLGMGRGSEEGGASLP